MTNATKFTFDTIFDASGEILEEAPKPQKRSYLAREVDIIREDSIAEGTRSAQAMADQAIASSLKQLSAVVESLFNVLDKEVENIRSEAAQLAFTIGSKIAGRLLDEAPERAIEDLIEECLGNLRSEPHIHIQVHPQHAGTIGQRMEETVSGRSFSGQLHISPSDGLSETDVRIEWANGGVEKSHQEIVKAIATIIDQKWGTSVLTSLEDPQPPTDQADAEGPSANDASPIQKAGV